MPILKSLTVENITSSGGTFTWDTASQIQDYMIYGTATMIGNITISPTGTPVLGLTYNIHYRATLDITTNSTTITIFGLSLTAQQALLPQEIIAIYNGSAWDVSISPSFSNSFIVATSNLANLSVTSGKLATGAITTGALANGSVTDTKLASDSVTTSKIIDGAVTNNKLANFTAKSLKYGDASGTPGDLVLGLNQIAIGNGTTITAIDKDSFAVGTFDSYIVDVSFEAGEVGSIIKLYLPYDCTIHKIRAVVSKTIAGTDNGTVTINDDYLTTTIATITAPASSALNTVFNYSPNYVYEDISGTHAGTISFTTAKFTTGGKLSITLTVERS